MLQPESKKELTTPPPEFYTKDETLITIKNVIFANLNRQPTAKELRIIEAAYLTGVPEILIELDMIDSSNLEEIVIELKRQFGADIRHQYKTFEEFEDDSKDRKKLTTLTEREIISTNFNCPAKMVHLDQLQGFYSYQTKVFKKRLIVS